jgi:hypothetical protein
MSLNEKDKARACEAAATFFHHECNCGRTRVSYITREHVYGPMMTECAAKSLQDQIDATIAAGVPHPFGYRVRIHPSAIVVALAERQEQKARAQ